MSLDKEEVQDTTFDTLEKQDVSSSSDSPRRFLQRQNAQLSLLVAPELDELGEGESLLETISAGQKSFLQRIKMLKKPIAELGRKQDPYHDYSEMMTVGGKEELKVPSLRECQSYLTNEETEQYIKRHTTAQSRYSNLVMNYLAAIFIYLASTVSLETTIVVLNAVLATYFYCENAHEYSAKLDFSFLAFSVVFPLTFLIQTVYARRDHALERLAEFKGALLATSLYTLTCDWSDGSSPTKGRSNLPTHFNENVTKDFRLLLLLVYQYLSMPQVTHGRNLVFPSKQKNTRRVHALQNDIVKLLNNSMFDLSMHTEVMRGCGFASGEASRLNQYHQYLQTRFEQLRVLKYYQTPQATRAFGRVYLFVLPWLSGPYFAWVYEETRAGYPFTLTLAGFTFLILLGLINTQRGLQDPFLGEPDSWTPGIDNVKLDYECAVTLQSIEQFYVHAEKNRMLDRDSDHERVAL